MTNDAFIKTFSVRSLGLYLIALVIVSAVFCNFFVGWHWVLWGVGATTFFFLGSCFFFDRFKNLKQRDFLLLIFFVALIIRVLYAWLMCYYYTFRTGKPLEYGASDSMFYHKDALQFSRIIEDGHLGEFMKSLLGKRVMFSDLGYIFSLGFIYYIFGPNVLIPRIIHALLSAYSCILIYKLSNRLFDNQTARIAAVMSVFMPLFVYYCGLHLKEIELAFFVILCIERTDFVIREKKNLGWNIFLIVFSFLMIFLYRISIGVCLMFSFVAYLAINNKRILSKKATIICLVFILMAVVCLIFSGIIWEIMWNFDSALYKVELNLQYLPGAFVLPLPKMTVEGNENQKLIHGMVFVKNIIGFFAMYSFVIAYREKKLREISFVAFASLSYLAIVSSVCLFSKERFYFPALPCLVVLAAYAISHFEKRDIKWFNAYLAVLLVAIIVWSYYNVNSL